MMGLELATFFWLEINVRNMSLTVSRRSLPPSSDCRVPENLYPASGCQTSPPAKPREMMWETDWLVVLIVRENGYRHGRLLPLTVKRNVTAQGRTP
jgi:hypothetical protein